MRHVALLLVLALGALVIAPASHAQALENLFDCTLKEGTSPADLLKFRGEYEEAAKADGIEAYELRVLFAIYSGKLGAGSFVWVGRFADVDVFAATSKWFQASNWPAEFDKLMTCEAASLWRVMP